MFVRGFPPVVSAGARVLVLGSMPGVESLRRHQYYAHPYNAFWYIMGRIYGFDPQLDYQERCTRIQEAGIALWDVLSECRREGSLDVSIEKGTEVPNDFETFLGMHFDIECIVFNGLKSRKIFDRLVWPQLPAHIPERMVLHRMPSTSPANTRLKRDEKLEIWREVLQGCIGKPES